MIMRKFGYEGNVAKVKGGSAMRDDKFDCWFFPPVISEPLVCMGEGKVFGMRLLRTSPVVNIEKCDHAYFCDTESGSCYVVIHHT